MIFVFLIYIGYDICLFNLYRVYSDAPQQLLRSFNMIIHDNIRSYNQINTVLLIN